MKPAATRWRFSWLGLVGLGLAVLLGAAMLLKARQFTTVQGTGQAAPAQTVLLASQTEADYLRLLQAWQRAAESAGDADAATLRLRFADWARRVGLLNSDIAQQTGAGLGEAQQGLARMQAFIAQASAGWDQPPGTAPDPGFLQRLLPALQALDADIHRLALGASQRAAEQSALREAGVREQNRLALAITLSLSALALAFAFIALHHLNQLRERRAALEALTAQLRQSQREAEAASEAKSAFLANMSHEIRTPFHGLMGMLSLLRETGLNARQIDYLRTATESADHLLALLNDILDMSQLEAGRMTLAPAATDLRGVLRDVEALMRPQANAKALALHFDADPGVPERVMLDATRVKQVLFNLLANAIKFSEQGAVVLDVRVRPAEAGDATHAEPPPMLEFVVTDTGMGMDAATVARLFKRFGQGDSSPSRRHGGTGLGLEISRNLARLMQGDITVRSKPGEGSAFSFRLPLVPVADAADAYAPGSKRESGARPLQVLVAEDHPVNRQYLAALLDNLGHQAHFTANGLEAVQAAREQRFDVVLMDLHMPEMDGLAATQAIRALPDRAAATVPIVALTADAFEQTRDRCLMAGMNDFLTKPVSPQKLATSLRRLFGSTPGLAALDGPPASTPAPPAPQPHGQPVIDTVALNMALQAMPRERLAQMIDTFLEQGPQTVQRLRTAVRDAQTLELRVNAHAAKGAALNLGLAGLAATASALHEGAAHLPAHEIARLVQRYEELLPVTRQAVAEAGLGLTLGP